MPLSLVLPVVPLSMVLLPDPDSCPACGAPLHGPAVPDPDSCPACGAPLHAPEPCPACGAPLHGPAVPDSESCPVCAPLHAFDSASAPADVWLRPLAAFIRSLRLNLKVFSL